MLLNHFIWLYIILHFILFYIYIILNIFILKSSKLIKSLTHEKINRFRLFFNMKLTAYSRLTRAQARKHDSYLWRHNNWRHRGGIIFSFLPREINKKILHACGMLSCNIGNYLIKRQSERYTIIVFITIIIIIIIINYFYSSLYSS